MQTIRDLRQNGEETIIPSGFTINGWSNVLSHEMNVLFQALCYAVNKAESKDEVRKLLEETKGLQATFDKLNQSKFSSEENYKNYINLLERHKQFLQRSNITYPTSLDEAIELFTKWGLVIDKGDHYDIPVNPFPDVREVFDLNERELEALNFTQFEALVHPVFSKLVLVLHEQDTNSFTYSKAELKELLEINDAMLTEVLIKLTPYMEEPIDNFQSLPDDEKMTFTVIWERIYEDYLGGVNPDNIQ
ncbi:DUF6042 family protein [Brevibacillus dissolubilis]|uniref:DUF6042 family protein n=1 Tax=Brevibacillus dissolubilis TaxID=1844116 RepID=UPI0011160691|nr:DUF6042 family protein [Brevibacillus dissolubilis]